MKSMTCTAMGGPATCDGVLTGNTPDEMIANGMVHVTAAHPDMLESIKAMPKEEMDKWTADFHAKWDAIPDMPAAAPAAAEPPATPTDAAPMA